MEGVGTNAQSSGADWLKSPAFAELQRAFQEHREQAMREDAQWWEQLSEEEKLRAFRMVCRLIYEGDVRKRGSYRYVLYDTFGFGPEAYSDGMDCGYMTIHNLIWQGIESQKPEHAPDCSLSDDEMGSIDNSF